MIELRRAADVFDLQRFLEDCRHARLMSQDPAEILSRLWHRPTMEVHGFEGVQHEPGVLKSALPYKVRAKISLRLVPGQEPKRVVSAFQNFLSQIHSGIRVYDLGGQKAGFTDLSHPHMALAAKACQQGFGRPALFVGCGGTIGSIPQMQRVFPEVPVVLIAQSLMSDGYHAPNEQFRLDQAINGCRTIAHYLHSLAAQ